MRTDAVATAAGRPVAVDGVDATEAAAHGLTAAALVALAPGYQHPGDPRQPDNIHRN